MRTQSQLAYILHKRAFRDTSQILEVFTRDYGKLSLMSRGSRSPKSKQNVILQLHQPLLIGWSGRGEIPLLNNAEAAELKPPRLTGRALLSAIYINELVSYLLHKHDVHGPVFDIYHACLYQLQGCKQLEPVLRLFEKNLLAELGFALNLQCDADSGEAISPNRMYRYFVEHGPVQVAPGNRTAAQPEVSGSSLLAYAEDQLGDVAVLKEIKNLNRHVLNHHLGNRKLRSRELFQRPQSL